MCGPCSASPVHSSFGRDGLEPAEGLRGAPVRAGGQLQPLEMPLQRALRRRPAARGPQDPHRPAPRCGRASPASAPPPAPAPAASVRGVTCRAGGASAVEPAAAPGPDPPVDRLPRHRHRLAERPPCVSRGQLPDQPAPLPGRQRSDRRPPGSAGTGTTPPARPAPPACGPPQPQTSATSSVKTATTASHRGSRLTAAPPRASSCWPPAVGHERGQQQPAGHRRGQLPPRHRAHPRHHGRRRGSRRDRRHRVSRQRPGRRRQRRIQSPGWPPAR